MIKDWTKVSEGAHGTIRKVHVLYNGFDGYVCIKLYTEQWKDAYVRESSAYALLVHRGIKRCIPEIHYAGELSRSRWDGEQPEYTNPDEILYGIVMEFFEDCEELDLRRLTLPLAEVIARALRQIHEARVLHNDLAERNILLVRESGQIRVVWVDFSCAWSGKMGRPLLWEYRGLVGMFSKALVHLQAT